MELRVIGCHGGETPEHRTTAFVVDDKLAIDAGSLTSGLGLHAQAGLEACLVSHAHLDHIRDLATIADNRCQAGCAPLVVAGPASTLRAVRRHFFNGTIWPDFSKIPSEAKPTIRYMPIPVDKVVDVAGYRVRAVPVSHTIDSVGFVVDDGEATLAYSGDTGPTDRLWEVLDAEPRLRALLMEVSFPTAELKLAALSGHHTPETMAVDLRKLAKPRELPTLLYHMKPAFQARIEHECAKLRGLDLTVLRLGDHFVL